MLNVTNAPDVGYYLSRHPETLAKLWALEGQGRGVEVLQTLNDLSAGLKFAGSTTQNGAGSAAHRERRAAPEPFKPVGGAAMNPSNGGYYEGMSQAEYNQRRNRSGGRR